MGILVYSFTMGNAGFISSAVSYDPVGPERFQLSRTVASGRDLGHEDDITITQDGRRP